MSRLIGSLGRRLRAVKDEERGVVLVLVAVSIVVILGMAALAVDVASWYQTQRQAQAAADAAALAGADDLPTSATTATTDANSYVSKNISNSTTTVTTPYNGSSSEIQVKVSVPGNLWFGNIFGISAPTITATSAAAANAVPAEYSIFADDSTCSDNGLILDNDHNTYVGAVNSNGDIDVQSNDNTFATVDYPGPASSCFQNTGSGNTFANSGPTIDSSDPQPWPYNYSSLYPSACTITGSSFTFQSDNGATLPSGVYCATGSIDILGDDLKGNVTFIASSLQLNGTGEQFTPYTGTHNLLVYQTGSSTLNIDDVSYAADGAIFAPSAQIEFNANNTSNQTITACIEAWKLDITTNYLTWDAGCPGSAGSGGSSLIQ